VALVFANVLLQQFGVPVPTLPTLVVAGALSVTGTISAPAALVAATVASLLADTVWYAAGIRYGRPVLTTLCRISLSPDSCVRQSEDRLARWGPVMARARARD
jgi:membrane protein DedA with SNARE-associated domain